MKIQSIILVIFFITGQDLLCQDCKKCDIQALVEISKVIENPDYTTVSNFICSLDTSCRNNVEFSEWSNSLIFSVINSDINLVNQVIHDLGYDYVLLVARELEDPTEEQDLKKIYGLVIESIGPKDLILEEKRAIIKAAEKLNIKLE